MPSFQTTDRVAHRADQMFDLVADVRSYPQFLPLCDDLTVSSTRTDPSGNELLIAEMTVAYKMFHETFTSRVILRRPQLVIETSYIDGPFSHMENSWRFEAVRGGTDCHFSIDYEFRSRTLGLVMSAVFDRAFRRFSTAFQDRADQLYG